MSTPPVIVSPPIVARRNRAAGQRGAALHRVGAKTRVSRNLPRFTFKLHTEGNESQPESCVSFLRLSTLVIRRNLVDVTKRFHSKCPTWILRVMAIFHQLPKAEPAIIILQFAPRARDATASAPTAVAVIENGNGIGEKFTQAITSPKGKQARRVDMTCA